MDWCSVYLTPQGLPKYIYLSPPLIFPIIYNGIRTKNLRDDIPQGAVAPGRLHYSKFTSKNNFNFKYRDLSPTTQFVYCFWAIHWRRLFTVNGKTIPRFNSYYYKLQFTFFQSFTTELGQKTAWCESLRALLPYVEWDRFVTLAGSKSCKKHCHC
jgi:hypothetical protein